MSELPERGGPTAKLWADLFESPSFASYLERCPDAVGLPSFSEYIRALCKERGEAPERVILRSDIERSFGHQIFRGTRRPSRDTVLRLAFGFQVDLELAQSLLRHANCGLLYPRVMRDAAIGYCLHNGIGLVDAQSVLLELGLPLIGERNV